MTFSRWLPHLIGLDLALSKEHLQPLQADAHLKGNLRPAVVLLLVTGQSCDESKVLSKDHSLVLTRRADHLAQHGGQIAFPGGKTEQDDLSLVHTALREAREETGIEADFITPLGFLSPCKTSSGFCVFPLVAKLRDGFTLKPDPNEVADIFEVSLAFLMSPENHHKTIVQWHGRDREVFNLPYQDSLGKKYPIWGVTAEIIMQLYDIDQNSTLSFQS